VKSTRLNYTTKVQSKYLSYRNISYATIGETEAAFVTEKYTTIYAGCQRKTIQATSRKAYYIFLLVQPHTCSCNNLGTIYCGVVIYAHRNAHIFHIWPQMARIFLMLLLVRINVYHMCSRARVIHGFLSFSLFSLPFLLNSRPETRCDCIICLFFFSSRGRGSCNILRF